MTSSSEVPSAVIATAGVLYVGLDCALGWQ
jgi:hypothetical protein